MVTRSAVLRAFDAADDDPIAGADRSVDGDQVAVGRERGDGHAFGHVVAVNPHNASFDVNRIDEARDGSAGRNVFAALSETFRHDAGEGRSHFGLLQIVLGERCRTSVSCS
jgi:hypothetical protein